MSMGKVLQKMRLMVGRAVINLVKDSGGLQIVQIDGLDGETRDGVERIQNYGFTSNPPTGSTAAVVAVAGSRDHLVAVACDHEEYRLKGLASGESAQYAQFGQILKFDKDGNATLTCKTLTLAVESLVNQAQTTTNAGTVQSSGGFTSPVAIKDGHSHKEHDNYITGGPQA